MSRHWLAPLNPLYALAVAAKNLAYDQSWLKAEQLRSPVIGIGNLSVGGSGKTPLTIRLAQLLSAQGFHVDVLSRGYGRSSQTTERVDHGGTAERFGDEPLLIAQRAEVPVFVGASRYAAGQLAEQDLAPGSRGVHLLDDGFQHRQLFRDVDIVVAHRNDFAERLLPAGRLREPLAALRRATFIALREEDADLETKIRDLGVQAPLWWMKRTVDLAGNSGPTPKRGIAFCGIARPAEFFAALRAMGIHLDQSIAFADHHRYTQVDMEKLARSAAKLQPDAFITTEKDAVKLNPEFRKMIELAAPFETLRLTVTLRDEASAIRQLLEKLPSS